MIARRVPLRRSRPLRRGVPPKRHEPLRKKRSRPRRGPPQRPDYLPWIRPHGCVIYFRMSGVSILIEAAPTNALWVPEGCPRKHPISRPYRHAEPTTAAIRTLIIGCVHLGRAKSSSEKSTGPLPVTAEA